MAGESIKIFASCEWNQDCASLPNAINQGTFERETQHQLTLIPVPLNTDMIINDHDFDMAVPFLFTRVDGPAHVFACQEKSFIRCRRVANTCLTYQHTRRS